jgi:hypothetical protein
MPFRALVIPAEAGIHISPESLWGVDTGLRRCDVEFLGKARQRGGVLKADC